MAEYLISGIGVYPQSEGFGQVFVTVGVAAESDPRTDADRPFVSEKPPEIGRYTEDRAARPMGRGGHGSLVGIPVETEGSADIVLCGSVAGAEKEGGDEAEKDSFRG